MPPTQVSIYRGDRSDFSVYAKLGSEDDTTIASVDTVADEFTLNGDKTPLATVGETILRSSNGNEFEISSITYNAGPDETVIGVVESITDPAEGYLLFPWNLNSDFNDIQAQVRYSEDGRVVYEWKTADGSMTLEDGDGTKDKMVFSVPPAAFDKEFAQTLLMDIEGLDANDEEFTLIEKGLVELDLTTDVTQA